MNENKKSTKLERLEGTYTRLMSRIQELCEQAEEELREIHKGG